MHAHRSHCLTLYATFAYARSLERFVAASFQVRRCPSDLRAKIILKVLMKEGAHLCPMCSNDLSIEGYCQIMTPFLNRRILACEHCGHQIVFHESQTV